MLKILKSEGGMIISFGFECAHKQKFFQPFHFHYIATYF